MEARLDLRSRQALLDAWGRGDHPAASALFTTLGLGFSEGDLEHLDDALKLANGRRSARTIGRPEVLDAAERAVRDGIAVVHGGEANDGNQVTTLCLAYREGHRLTVGVGVSAARSANPGRAWKELQPWSQRPEKSLVRLSAWARARAADRVRVELRELALPGDALHENEAALLEQVLLHPDDDRPRLVMADWLQQQGDARGELIALQVRAARSPPEDAGPLLERAGPLLERAGALLQANAARWTHELRQFTLKQRFERGFVEHVEMRAEGFPQHAARLFALAPVRSVWLRGVQPSMLKRLAAVSELERLSDLDLSHGQVTDAGARTLAESPHLTHLRRLGVVSSRVGPSGLWALLREFPALEELRLLTVDRELARELARAKRELTVVCANPPAPGVEEGLGPRIHLEVRALPMPSAPR